MNNSASPGGWVCPACDRRVPGKVNECRCGYARDGGASVGEAGQIGAAPASHASAVLRSGVVVLVAIGAIVGIRWYVTRGAATPAPVSQAVPPPAVPDATRPATTTPAAVNAAAPTGGASVSIRPTDLPPAVPAPVRGVAAPSSLEDVVGRVMSAVVGVETNGGSGSGFFVAPDTLLTNVHVVDNNTMVTIRRPDGATASARVATTAPDFDLAVLKISNPVPNQVTIPLGSIATTRVGQEVIAIGSALGMLQNTVTRGIVSGVRRVGSATLVQTDAALNPGNSGGPLLDRNGTAVGVNTMGFRGNQGLNFAVSIDHARAVLEGRPQPAASNAPATQDQSLRMLSPALPSGPEQQREKALHRYEETLVQLARRANSLDDYWGRFKTACYNGRVGGSFDREWFAIWDPKAMRGTVAVGCGSNFDEIQRAAGEIRDGVLAAEEAARHSDVYPGSRRDLRRKYRLDYSGWDR